MFLLLLACAEPFDVRRQDLGPFRIAAVGVEDGLASAAIYSGEGMGHATAPTLTWSVDGQVLGTGWDVAVPASGTLELEADSGTAVEFARVSIQEAADVAWTRTEEDGVVRLELDAPERSARWMTADAVNEAIPVEPLAAEVTWDEPGLAHHLALVQDGQGGNRWVWIDSAFGVDGLARHEGRLVEAAGVGSLAATLVPGDDGGVALDDLSEDLSDVELLPCVPESSFRLAWVADGRCGLDEVVGARVEIELW